MATTDLSVTIADPQRPAALRRAVASARPARDALERVAETARLALDAPAALVDLACAGAAQLLCAGGLDGPLRSGGEPALEPGLLAHAVAGGAPLLVGDLREDARFRGHPLVARHGAVACAGAPLVGADGRVAGVLAVLDRRPRAWSERDRTLLLHLAASAAAELELRRELEASHESEQRFRLIAEASSDVLWESEVATGEMWRSDSFHAAFGYAPDPGGTAHAFWDAAIHPDDRERVVAGYENALLRDDAVWRCEYRLRRADGSYAHVLDRGLILRDANGAAVRVVGAMMDVTAHKQADQERRLAEQRLRAVIDTSPLPIIVLDPDLTVRGWNPAAERVFGWSQDEVVGRPYPVAAADPREVAALFERGLRGAPVSGAEIRRLTRDGSPVELKIWTECLTDELGNVNGLVGVLVDVTEQKRLEKRLQQAHKMEAVGRLAGGVAHDFNNLLTAIAGFAELLLDDLDAGDPRRLDVEEIRRAAERASALTRQLLAYSRQQVLQPRTLDLNAVVTALQRLLDRLLREDTRLETRLAGALGNVRADPGQIEQVVVNLVLNARDAVPEGGRIVVETANVRLDADDAARLPFPALPGDYVRLSVADDGVGIEPDALPHIFDPFFTTKEPGKGTGLGLSTVYGIVRQSGGFIHVESAPGAGTRLDVHLPRTDAGTTAPDAG